MCLPKIMTMQPFIIWTLQRTGGTNLTQRLVERSGLPGTEHEPFNIGRVFGGITQRWAESRDALSLRAEIDAVCRKRVNIKHCVEMVPWEVTQALIEQSSAVGFRHLFLFRRHAAQRLLSLHFAKQSGIWGPAHEGRLSTDIDKLETRLPVAALVQHEGRCAQWLQRAWDLLVARDQYPMAIAFEDIYASDPAVASRALLATLAALGLLRDAGSNTRFVNTVHKEGNQGTRDAYTRFIGTVEVEQALSALPSFKPEAPAAYLDVRPVEPLHPWVLRALVDKAPPLFTTAMAIDVSGVVVLSPLAPRKCRLLLVGPAGKVPAKWGIVSRWMKQQFPDSPNSGHARFEVICRGAGAPLRLILENTEDPSQFVELFNVDTKRLAPERLLQVATAALKSTPVDPALHALYRRELDAVAADQRGADWQLAAVAVDAAFAEVTAHTLARFAQAATLPLTSVSSGEFDKAMRLVRAALESLPTRDAEAVAGAVAPATR